MLFDEILAQHSAIGALQRAIAAGRLAHAYLFEGPSGVGKQKTALALACSMICRASPPGCGRCEACKRILAGIHPDVRVFAPREEGDRNIQVEFLRDEVLPYTRYAPFEAETAFVIFPRADVSFPVQHAQSANALLKTLEEPRAKLHFLLLAERPDRLLATIRSRCQRLRFGPLPADAIDKILEARAIPATARRAAAALADGRADRAIELAREGKAEQMLDMARRIDAVAGAGNPAEILDLSEEMARGDDLSLILETLARFYRDQAASTLGHSEPVRAFEREGRREAGANRSRPSAREAAERVSLVQQAADALERNANRQIALDALLFQLRAGASAGSD